MRSSSSRGEYVRRPVQIVFPTKIEFFNGLKSYLSFMSSLIRNSIQETISMQMMIIFIKNFMM